MRLTRQTNYAIRLMMYCAANPDGLSRVADVAKAYGVSELFLFKILQTLVENRLVETVRGRNGGVRLARPPETITLFDIVTVTEDSFAMADCFEKEASDCPLIDACSLSAALRRALGAFFEVLEEYSIADLVAAKADINALLGLPPQPERAVSPAA